jgi:hypothetical protein
MSTPKPGRLGSTNCGIVVCVVFFAACSGDGGPESESEDCDLVFLCIDTNPASDAADTSVTSDTSSDAESGTEDTNNGSETGPEAAQSLVDHLDALVGAACSRIFACDEASGVRAQVTEQFGADDAVSCGDALKPALLDAIWSSRAQAVSDGRAAFVAARAAQCLELAESGACDLIFATEGELDQCMSVPPTNGLLAAGEACDADWECADEALRCGRPLDAPAGSPGRCEPGLGGTCFVTSDCLAAHYCDQPGQDADSTLESVGYCAPRAERGEECEDRDGCVAPAQCEGAGGVAPNGEPIDGICQ